MVERRREMKRMTVITKAFLIISAVIIIASGAVIGAGIYTNGFESIRTRYVKVDGKEIKKNGSVRLKQNGENIFVLDGAGFKAVDWGEYSVKIETNADYGLGFELAGKPYQYAGIEVTEYLTVRLKEGYFTLSGESNPIRLMKKIYGSEVKITQKGAPNVSAYIMTVTPSKGKAVRLGLLEYIVEPEGIEMPGGVVVG